MKVCNFCHIAFDSKLKECPSCHRIVEEKKPVFESNKEGEGRKYGTGGEACDYCDHCYGNANWCPMLD